MANWLEKIIPRSPRQRASGARNVPANVRRPSLPAPYRKLPAGAQQNTGLPNASIVYGMASAALFAICLCFLVAGRWVTALLVLFPAVGLLGFSLHFIKHPDH